MKFPCRWRCGLQNEFLPRILLTAAKLLVTPVAVSLWTIQTALIVCALSAAIFSARISRLAPWPHSLSMTSTLNLRRFCWSIHSKLNCPIRNDTVRSPGDNVFVSALSHAPVPEPRQQQQYVTQMKSKLSIFQWQKRRTRRRVILCCHSQTIVWSMHANIKGCHREMEASNHPDD